MYLLGCTSHFCLAHQERSKGNHWETACTSARVSGLTDPVWVRLFAYRGAAWEGYPCMVVGGGSGLRNVLARRWVGSSLTRYQMGQAAWTIWAPPATDADKQTPAEASGNRKRENSCYPGHNGAAAGSLAPDANEHDAMLRPAQSRQLRVALLSREECWERSHRRTRKGCEKASTRGRGRRR